MRFIVDAQLPRLLAYRLREAGHDAMHTADLLEGNRTTDNTIIALSRGEQRIIITKDTDFLDSFLIGHGPWKLLLVSTGNIRNDALDALINARLGEIEAALVTADFIELTRTRLIVHQ